MKSFFIFFSSKGRSDSTKNGHDGLNSLIDI